MHLPRTLLAALTLVCAVAAPAQAQDPAAPVAQTPQARFKVTVTADAQIVDAVYDFMMLVAARNEARARFGTGAPSAELELVRLVQRRAQMPQYHRDIGVVMLRLDQAAGTTTVEYCLAKCDSKTPRLARYVTSITKFVENLAEATADLARYRGR